jgi:hypothetical protein
LAPSQRRIVIDIPDRPQRCAVRRHLQQNVGDDLSMTAGADNDDTRAHAL